MKDDYQVVGEHPCDDEYQVTTVQGPSRHRRRICATCPWRMDVPTGVFPPEAYRHSASSSYDMSTQVFSCHESGRAHPQTCVGFLLRGADHNLQVRLNPVDPAGLDDTGAPLYPNYRAMAEANGVDPDDPALSPCRDD